MRIRTIVAAVAGLATVTAGVVTTATAGAEETTGSPTSSRADGPGGAATAAAAVRADFDGDGYRDLVTAAPGGTVNGARKAGYVVVSYGSADGIDAARSTVLSQATPGVPGDPSADDRFGSRLVARDFDRDGVSDLAVTTPYELGYEGNVTLLWGGSDGLTGQDAAVAQVPSGQGTAWDLHGGDFDGDGRGDLLVPNMGAEAPAFSILHGPFTRAGAPARESGLVEMKYEDDINGMAVGDVTGDGADDVVAFFSFQGNAEGGSFFQGGSDGLTETAPMNVNGVTPTIGDFDGDGKGDIAYRHPGWSVEDLPYQKGTVKVVYGTANGPSETRRQTFTQDTAGVPGVGEDGDQFGGRLEAGDVNGDGYDDLAVGVPYEDAANAKDAGSVVLLKGGARGIGTSGAQGFGQNSPGVKGVAEAGDRFGSALRLQDLDGDGKADLAIGAPGENAMGAIWSLRGATGGLTATGSVAFSPVNVEGAPPAGADFGYTFVNEDRGSGLYTQN